jgi:hypothetical protein
VQPWQPADPLLSTIDADSLQDLTLRVVARLQARAASFKQQWGAYSHAQVQAAQQQPLPRRFAARFDPASGQQLFVDLNERQMHAVHPNVAALEPALAAQRAAGEAQLQASCHALRTEAEVARAAAQQVASHALDEIMVIMLD